MACFVHTTRPSTPRKRKLRCGKVSKRQGEPVKMPLTPHLGGSGSSKLKQVHVRFLAESQQDRPIGNGILATGNIASQAAKAKSPVLGNQTNQTLPLVGSGRRQEFLFFRHASEGVQGQANLKLRLRHPRTP